MPITRYQFLLDSLAKHHDSDACLIWPYGKHSFGYGNCWDGTESVLVHVLAYSLANGTLLPLPKGKVVRHSCDTPQCFNPRHLTLGSQKQNIGDAIKRGRYKCVGANNNGAILTDSKVKEIRSIYGSGQLNQYEIAKLFSVSRSCIADIVTRRLWTHI